MYQAGDTGGFASSDPKRARIFRVVCLRGAAILALAALAWAVWSRRGAVLGGVEAFVLAFAALRLAGLPFRPSASWAARHPTINRTGSYIFGAAIFMWPQAMFDSRETSTEVLVNAAVLAATMAAVAWRSDRKRVRASRRKLLTTLATDLERHLETLRRSAGPQA